jgi:hypothetical protein
MSNCAADRLPVRLQTSGNARPKELEMTKVILLVAVVASALLVVAAAPAAVTKDGDVLRRGTCTGSSTSKIKLSEEDGRIEVEFEVDQNRNGVRWNVVLRQNGRRIARLVRVTRGPSGSFEARVVAPNRPGTDTFVATASRSGETCRARAGASF